MKKKIFKRALTTLTALVLCAGAFAPAFAADKVSFDKPLPKEAEKLVQDVDTQVIHGVEPSQNAPVTADFAKGYKHDPQKPGKDVLLIRLEMFKPQEVKNKDAKTAMSFGIYRFSSDELRVVFKLTAKEPFSKDGKFEPHLFVTNIAPEITEDVLKSIVVVNPEKDPNSLYYIAKLDAGKFNDPAKKNNMSANIALGPESANSLTKNKDGDIEVEYFVETSPLFLDNEKLEALIKDDPKEADKYLDTFGHGGTAILAPLNESDAQGLIFFNDYKIKPADKEKYNALVEEANKSGSSTTIIIICVVVVIVVCGVVIARKKKGKKPAEAAENKPLEANGSPDPNEATKSEETTDTSEEADKAEPSEATEEKAPDDSDN